MTYRGRIQNGVVVLEAGATIPEQTSVVVIPETPPDEGLVEPSRQQLLSQIARIATLPLEGSDDGFSGADHDQVLYGKP